MLFNKIFTSATAIALSFIPLSVKAAGKCTMASFYGHGDIYHGRTTANGERFNGYGISTAHRTLPFGTRVVVINPANNKSVTVRVNDRGPFVAGRDLDLSYGAFSKIASPSQGVVKVCYSRA